MQVTPMMVDADKLDRQNSVWVLEPPPDKFDEWLIKLNSAKMFDGTSKYWVDEELWRKQHGYVAKAKFPQHNQI